jgi:hypothetical protein
MGIRSRMPDQSLPAFTSLNAAQTEMAVNLSSGKRRKLITLHFSWANQRASASVSLPSASVLFICNQAYRDYLSVEAEGLMN